MAGNVRYVLGKNGPDAGNSYTFMCSGDRIVWNVGYNETTKEYTLTNSESGSDDQ